MAPRDARVSVGGQVFLLYLFSAFVGVCFPRFRVEQSIRFFLVWAVPLGILSIMAA